MAASDIAVYGTVLSGHTHRVELLLRMLRIPYRFVDSPAEVRRSAEFRALNPFGQVPVLKDGDLVLADSSAIRSTSPLAAARHRGFPRTGASRVQRWLSIAAGEVKYGPGFARLTRSGRARRHGPAVRDAISGSWRVIWRRAVPRRRVRHHRRPGPHFTWRTLLRGASRSSSPAVRA
jgi:glutathione S-transferase